MSEIPSRPSAETMRLNPHLFQVTAKPLAGRVASSPEDDKSWPTSGQLGRGKGMNRTESLFAARLDMLKQDGFLRRWQFEGLTLRIGPRRYTPDFVCVDNGGRIRLCEVKGPFIRPDSALKFDLFREVWPEFEWQMWQKTKEGWRQIK